MWNSGPAFSTPAFWSCIFLPWIFGPSFSSCVGRSLMIGLVPHWSFIFHSCIFSRPFLAICTWLLVTLHYCRTRVFVCPLFHEFCDAWDGWPCTGSVPGAGHLSRYITSHPGRLSLTIPSWVGVVSTSQTVVMPCSWGVKIGMTRVWMAGKTVWSPVTHGTAWEL